MKKILIRSDDAQLMEEFEQFLQDRAFEDDFDVRREDNEPGPFADPNEWSVYRVYDRI